VQVIDPGTLAMPDWRGNNRMDSLRNIVEDGRLSLMFMVPGNTIAVRVNGMGKVTVDPGMLARFSQSGQHPRSVVVIEISEIYFQCSRALMRSGLWQAHDSTDDLPSAGDILADVTGGAEGGAQYDEAWPARAKASLW
jgi:PPOX class probable FMN-dependent enzyme